MRVEVTLKRNDGSPSVNMTMNALQAFDWYPPDLLAISDEDTKERFTGFVWAPEHVMEVSDP